MDPIPSQDEIRRGDTTDVYFVRTMEVLRSLRKDGVQVKAEVFVNLFPRACGVFVENGTELGFRLFKPHIRTVVNVGMPATGIAGEQDLVKGCFAVVHSSEG